MLNTEGQRQPWLTMALIGWKAGHYHWLWCHAWDSGKGLLKHSPPKTVGSFPSPGGGRGRVLVNSYQQFCQQWSVWACEQGLRGKLQKVPEAGHCLETSQAIYVYDILGWENRFLAQP